MKNKTLDTLISFEEMSIEKILNIYLMEGFIKTPEIFGLKNFSEKELMQHLFHKAGDDNFCLWEKYYRIVNKNHYINLKLYFVGNKYESNGIGVSGVKAKKILNKYAFLYGKSNLIKKIQLYLGDSKNYGSIIINDFIDFRFDKKGAYHLKKKSFEFTGLSTDISMSKEFTEKQIDTKHARKTKEYFSFLEAKKKFPHNKALMNLIEILLRNFPGACH